MILTGAEMKALEQRAFADGVTAEALMEEAGRKIAEAVRQFFPVPGHAHVYFGKGHNGGDALVAARYLALHGWTFDWYPTYPKEQWARLTRKMWQAAQDAGENDELRPWVTEQPEPRPVIVLDGLLGIGAGGNLREPILSASREINELRATRHARVFSLDLPTGLDAGHPYSDTVVADYTLTVGLAKRGLLADAATPYVGRLAVLPLEELTRRVVEGDPASVATANELTPLLPPRGFDTHKGDCGRVGIVAGSRGLTGAARLCAEACVRGGAGLITLFVPEDIYPIVAAATIPEVMVRPVKSYLEVLEMRTDVLALGPGLGLERAKEIRELIRRAPQAMVVDADALNVLSEDLSLLDRCAGPRLLTPHPGEMARLDPGAKDRSRKETVETFTARYPHVLLLKGARTIIGQRSHPISYNTTGSPGMATGGMGDVLTGVCAALAGQKLSLYDAARVGAWICGRAAELALASGTESEESLTPTALLARLGPAFLGLRARDW